MTPSNVTARTQVSIPAPPWISTFSGRRLSYASPQCDQICLADIAHGLSQEPRFAGQCNHHWSVASHTILMVEAAFKYFPDYIDKQCVRTPCTAPTPHSDLIAAILLHDASEAYGKDIPAPLKALHPDLQKFHHHLTDLIYSCYGVNPSTEDQQFIHALDLGVQYAEARAILTGGTDSWNIQSHIPVNMAELKYGIHERSIPAVEAMFLRQLYDYVGE